MSIYWVITYDVTDPERYAEYNPGSLREIQATLKKHDGVLVFGGKPEPVRGAASNAAVGIKFPDADAAKAWLDDPDYAEAKAIRLESTDNITSYIANGIG